MSPAAGPLVRRRHGSRVGDLDRAHFVVAVQNHDQVGNRARGDRFGTLLAPEAQRLACGLLLLSPCVPLLFMGEEYGETRPFPFFCSFGDAGLIEAVRRGRREEFAALAFQWGSEIPDPQEPATFASAKLSWQWPAGSPQAGLRRWYEDLLAARRKWPPLRDRGYTFTSLTLEREAAMLMLTRGTGDNLVACANLTAESRAFRPLSPDSRPLLLSSAEQRYGGPHAPGEPWQRLYPYELALFGNREWLR